VVHGPERAREEDSRAEQNLIGHFVRRVIVGVSFLRTGRLLGTPVHCSAERVLGAWSRLKLLVRAQFPASSR